MEKIVKIEKEDLEAAKSDMARGKSVSACCPVAHGCRRAGLNDAIMDGYYVNFRDSAKETVHVRGGETLMKIARLFDTRDFTTLEVMLPVTVKITRNSGFGVTPYEFRDA